MISLFKPLFSRGLRDRHARAHDGMDPSSRKASITHPDDTLSEGGQDRKLIP